MAFKSIEDRRLYYSKRRAANPELFQAYSREFENSPRRRTYVVWRDMISRCYDSNRKDYPRYGGRGIKVCKPWRNSFETFLLDMGLRPNGLQIDRKNNMGNYSKSNCKWSTPKEQQNNRRDNHFISYSGKTLTLSQWENETGISQDRISQRLIYGWTIERTLTTP